MNSKEANAREAFEVPKAEVVRFGTSDVIATSVPDKKGEFEGGNDDDF